MYALEAHVQLLGFGLEMQYFVSTWFNSCSHFRFAFGSKGSCLKIYAFSNLLFPIYDTAVYALNAIPVEKRAVVANDLGPVVRQLVLLLVVPQAVFPGGREFARGTLVVLQN